MAAPSLQLFRVGWGSEQPGLVDGVCGRAWNKAISKVPSRPNHFMARMFH